VLVEPPRLFESRLAALSERVQVLEGESLELRPLFFEGLKEDAISFELIDGAAGVLQGVDHLPHSRGLDAEAQIVQRATEGRAYKLSACDIIKDLTRSTLLTPVEGALQSALRTVAIMRAGAELVRPGLVKAPEPNQRVDALLCQLANATPSLLHSLQRTREDVRGEVRGCVQDV